MGRRKTTTVDTKVIESKETVKVNETSVDKKDTDVKSNIKESEVNLTKEGETTEVVKQDESNVKKTKKSFFKKEKEDDPVLDKIKEIIKPLTDSKKIYNKYLAKSIIHYYNTFSNKNKINESLAITNIKTLYINLISVIERESFDIIDLHKLLNTLSKLKEDEVFNPTSITKYIPAEWSYGDDDKNNVIMLFKIMFGNRKTDEKLIDLIKTTNKVKNELKKLY